MYEPITSYCCECEVCGHNWISRAARLPTHCPSRKCTNPTKWNTQEWSDFPIDRKIPAGTPLTDLFPKGITLPLADPGYEARKTVDPYEIPEGVLSEKQIIDKKRQAYIDKHGDTGAA